MIMQNGKLCFAALTKLLVRDGAVMYKTAANRVDGGAADQGLAYPLDRQ